MNSPLDHVVADIRAEHETMRTTQSYAIFKNDGEWLGAVHHVDSSLDARREWVDSFGRTLGIGIRQTYALRVPS